MWGGDERIPEDFGSTYGMTYRESGTPRKRTHSREGVVISFVLFLVALVAFAMIGAPGFFLAIVFLGAVLFLIIGLVSSVIEDEKIARAEEAESEARERFKQEVAQSVKEKLDGTIKVRCRYCGALNGEDDEKCESCGAPL